MCESGEISVRLFVASDRPQTTTRRWWAADMSMSLVWSHVLNLANDMLETVLSMARSITTAVLL
jgi:hypothetical protein